MGAKAFSAEVFGRTSNTHVASTRPATSTRTTETRVAIVAFKNAYPTA